MNNNDYFLKNKQLLGRNYENIKNKKVAVIGLGGVGCFAVESLVRLGVENILICDFDKVDKTNINRQIIANKKSINKKKTYLFKKRIKKINPNINLTIKDMKIDEKTIENLFEEKIDFLIDAIDTIYSKTLLIKECSKRNIKMVSCLAMGNRVDPTQIKIGCFNDALISKDPIAKKIKSILKENITVLDNNLFVYSSEISKIKIKPPSSIVLTPSCAGIYCSYVFLKTFL